MKTLLTLVAALAAASPVLAQDAAGDRQTFSGPFVGAQLGWQQDRQTLNLQTLNSTSRTSLKSDGFAYGGQLGYDFRLSPSWVLGAELSVSGRTGGENLDAATRLTTGRTFNATGRIGYVLDADGLLYARGGYANTQYRVSNAGGRTSEDRGGWTVGAGYERYILRNVSARLEYNYSDFGSDNLPFIATALGGVRADLDYRRHAVTAGINFRF